MTRHLNLSNTTLYPLSVILLTDIRFVDSDDTWYTLYRETFLRLLFPSIEANWYFSTPADLINCPFANKTNHRFVLSISVRIGALFVIWNVAPESKHHSLDVFVSLDWNPLYDFVKLDNAMQRTLDLSCLFQVQSIGVEATKFLLNVQKCLHLQGFKWQTFQALREFYSRHNMT